jgi:hypothetical protein
MEGADRARGERRRGGRSRYVVKDSHSDGAKAWAWRDGGLGRKNRNQISMHCGPRPGREHGVVSMIASIRGGDFISGVSVAT